MLLARFHLGGFRRDRDLAAVFQMELRQSAKFMERFSTTQLCMYLDHLRDAVINSQAWGLFPADANPTVTAKAFFGAGDEMGANRISRKRSLSLANDTDAVDHLSVNGMKKPL